MSLNRNNIKFFRRFSLKTKLSLLFTSLFFLLISIVAFVSYGTLIHLFHKAEYDLLFSETETIKYIIQQNNIATLKHEIYDTPGVPISEAFQYYIRVSQEKTNVYLETKGMSTILALGKNTNNKKLERFQKSKRHYFLMESRMVYQNEPWTIQILLDTTYQQNLQIKYGKLLIFMLIIGAFLSGILGYFIMKRSIRSLIDMTKAAKTITANSLNQRMDADYWPKEFSELGFAFNNMLDRIEESFLRLRSFSADLAHELRTPINNLMGETEVALLQSEKNVNYRQTLEFNLEEMKLIAAMVENLLFLAQAENPRLVLKKENIHVSDIIHKIKDYYEEIALEKCIAVDIKGEATFFGNLEMFARMISNLISNSLKYTNQNGKIVIDILETKESVAIQLKDSGIGINEVHLPRLFDRFYRIDEARARDSGGVGLGLAIVKSIVDLHHGKIHLSSKIDVGTCFTMQFPK